MGAPTIRSKGKIAVGSLVVGAGGTPVKGIAVYSPVLSPAAVGANTTAEQTFTGAALAALAVGDFVDVNKPSAQAGIGIVGARVSAAGTLAITFNNHTGAAITPTPAEVYLVCGIRT